MHSIASSFRRVPFAHAVAALLLSACVTSGNKINYQSHGYTEVTISAYISKPEGAGPFPAVVLLHGCTGLERDTYEMAWKGLNGHAKFLNENGFVALIVDSHGSRGISAAKAQYESCVQGRGFRERTYDVYGALDYLESQPFIIPGKIALMGFSQGGSVIFNSLEMSEKRRHERHVAAGVPVYPDCSYAGRPNSFYAPILIIAGSSDNITPSRECEFLVEVSSDKFRNQEAVVPEIVVLPGVHHSFDLPLRKSQITPLGTVAPDYGATKKARALMLAFLKDRMGLE